MDNIPFNQKEKVEACARIKQVVTSELTGFK